MCTLPTLPNETFAPVTIKLALIVVLPVIVPPEVLNFKLAVSNAVLALL